MSITNCLLEQIKNPTLKEILESTIYVNNQPDGEVYTMRAQSLVSNSAGSTGSTVAEHLISQNIENAVKLANQNFDGCNVKEGVLIIPQVFEDYFFLGLFDLINVG